LRRAYGPALGAVAFGADVGTHVVSAVAFSRWARRWLGWSITGGAPCVGPTVGSCGCLRMSFVVATDPAALSAAAVAAPPGALVAPQAAARVLAAAPPPATSAAIAAAPASVAGT